jgi:transposase
MDYEAIIAQKDQQIQALKADYDHLVFQLENLKKLIFGSKKETFKSIENPNQLSLFEDNIIEPVIDLPKEYITTTRLKSVKKHEGRNEIPSHLPVEEIILEPELTPEGAKEIGYEKTETLHYTPASLVRRVYVRKKYAIKSEEGQEQIIIGKLPTRPIDKGIAEASLLAHIIASKFIDHLPFYRQIEIFKRDFQWILSRSTINDWFVACCTLLEPLYKVLEQKVKSSNYIQGDESPIRVLDKDKEGSSHQGYQWVFHSVVDKLVLMRYSPGRGEVNVRDFLIDYKGVLQCDGYAVYEKIATINPEITLVGCMAHIRRKIYEAQKADSKRASHLLTLIQSIYTHEAETKEYSAEERKQYRIENVKPLLDQIKSYIEAEIYKVTPKSPIGMAMGYAQKQWYKIEEILEHGQVAMDNNLIENKIRPLALGRKNYLFAGSHEGAQRIAMMYSFFGTCKANNVNPKVWLENTLTKIKDTKLSELHTLLPL